MSLRCMVQVLERYPADCAPGEKLLALCLADNADGDGEHIYPSVATMARRSLQSDRTVQRQLAYMQAMNWLQLVKRSRGRGNPAHYRINPDWLAGKKDDTLTPISRTEKGDTVTPIPDKKGVIRSSKRVTTATKKGDNGDTTYKPYRTVNTTSPLPPAGRGEQAFVELVQAYPLKRADEKRAAVVWTGMRPSQALADRIVVAAKALAATDEWRRFDGQYAPKLSKWLRNEGWKQAPSVAAPAAQGAPALAPEPQRTPEELAHSKAVAQAALANIRAMLGRPRSKAAA